MKKVKNVEFFHSSPILLFTAENCVINAQNHKMQVPWKNLRVPTTYVPSTVYFDLKYIVVKKDIWILM